MRDGSCVLSPFCNRSFDTELHCFLRPSNSFKFLHFVFAFTCGPNLAVLSFSFRFVFISATFLVTSSILSCRSLLFTPFRCLASSLCLRLLNLISLSLTYDAAKSLFFFTLYRERLVCLCIDPPSSSWKFLKKVLASKLSYSGSSQIASKSAATFT